MSPDYNAMRLKYHGDSAKLWDILQMECRHKCLRKLPRTLANASFEFPSLAVAEMSTSDDVADIHASMVGSGEYILDMTCGLGIDTFAMARHAGHVTSVEIDAGCYESARRNAAALGLENITIIKGDSVEWLKEHARKFDVIFIDPARRDASGRHFSFRDCSPDITEALPLMLEKGKRVFVKASPMIDITGAMREIGMERCGVTVIGTRKECKEVVFEIDAAGSADYMRCVTVGYGTYEHAGAVPEKQTLYAIPSPGEILLQPWPAVMKGGGLSCLATGDIRKLHPNTHLFIATDGKCDGFPGDRFEIKEVIPFNKEAVRSFSRSYPMINVAVRNFPMQAQALAGKLKVKDGGDRMVFGVTAGENDRKYLIVTSMAR